MVAKPSRVTPSNRHMTPPTTSSTSRVSKASSVCLSVDKALAKSNLLCLVEDLQTWQRWTAFSAYFDFVRACFTALVISVIVEALFSQYDAMKRKGNMYKSRSTPLLVELSASKCPCILNLSFDRAKAQLEAVVEHSNGMHFDAGALSSPTSLKRQRGVA